MQNEQQTQQEQQQQESIVNRVWNGAQGAFDTVSDQAMHLPETTGQYVQQAPFTASLVSFGVGVGLGLIVSQLLIPQRRRQTRWYDNYLGCDRAEAMEDMAHRYLPNSVSRRLGV